MPTSLPTSSAPTRRKHGASPEHNGLPQRGPAGLAAEIQRIRQQLTSPDALNHPRVLTELHELYKQVATGLDQHRGRHRMPVPVTVTVATRRGPAPRPAIAEPVPDAGGLNLKPDPLGATTSAELVAALRRYRQWSGDPSFRAMAAGARQRVAHSTMYVALTGTSLPKLRVVLAIITGCGGGQDDQRAFASAWRRIRSADA